MYNHSEIEKNILALWEKNDVYNFDINAKGKKAYILDMFPYPSGQGLHVGHPKGYTATDVFSRFKKLNGFNVLHPIGWDAFGLPAEQYAIQTKSHPATFTNKNIDNFRQQLKSLGFCFDYKKEVNTTDEKYYKWTQWIFSQMYKHDLAEIRNIDVNWCEQLKTVLANEEVLIKDGKTVSERGEFPVTKRKMRQWVLKITNYADRLIDDLKETKWPTSLINIQTSWIGRSSGLEIKFKTTVDNVTLTIYTTRPDTIYGVSFIAIAPENTIVGAITTLQQKNLVKQYIETTKSKSLLQRQEQKDKTCVFTGNYAYNPVNNKKIPIYIADYVLNDYATGMVMAVPSCDKRDYDFAKQNKINFIKIIDSQNDCEENDGLHINSEILNGLNILQATEKIKKILIDKKVANIKKNYKLKDWIFSRQRYWGEPFPIVFDQDNNPHLLEKLPVKIPFMKDIIPSIDGKSPLANLTDWKNIVIDNQKFQRETNTMPQWAGSCWYYIAYLLKQDNGDYLPLNSPKAKEILKKWLPVDLYVGGQEHAVLHLLYARFWHKFLYDIGIVSNKEPFYELINQGMILGTNGEKMSKSKGNVINPNDIVKNYGADTLRLFEIFMGPITATLPWSETGLFGARKWLDKVYNWYMNSDLNIVDEVSKIPEHINRAFHIFVKDITADIEKYKFNVAVSKMMIYLNSISAQNNKTVYLLHHQKFLVILSIFCPFLAEYLYQKITNDLTKFIFCHETWPEYDNKFTIQATINLPIQINGKVKDIIQISANLPENKVIEIANNRNKIKNIINGKKIKKIIYINNKIINFIV